MAAHHRLLAAATGLGALVDLVAPLDCAGCGRPGSSWCERCACLFVSNPIVVRTRAELQIPVWALARHGGGVATAVSAHKDRGRSDMAVIFAAALAQGIDQLRQCGEIADVHQPLVLVPVPCSARARRQRGRDHMREVAGGVAAELAATYPTGPLAVAPLVQMRGRMADAAGLDARQREHNLGGRVHCTTTPPWSLSGASAPRTIAEISRSGATVLLLDDVVATGATLAACTRALLAGGIVVSGAMCVTAA